MLVFLATPYSQLCDEKYRVKEEYANFFKKLTSKIKELGVDYFLAIERENYGKEYSSDTESTLIDYNTIQKCDLLCVLPGIPNSGGVHVSDELIDLICESIKIEIGEEINDIK